MTLKNYIYSFLILLFVSCTHTTSTKNTVNEEAVSKPQVSFTFDDGITTDLAGFKFEDWNTMILSAMKKEGVSSVFFVTGANKVDDKGEYLLNSWSNAGHFIANHTYTHPYVNSDKITVEKFEEELLKTDTIISKYDTYVKLFRFPYLKEGNTEKKITGFRNVLSKNGYRNGYVTIDASDWYVNSELIKYIKREGKEGPKIEQYKEFYLQHILERANYYEELAFELTNQHIKHTLLLHHNLTSALFLEDLITKFKDEGWEVINADDAFNHDIFKSQPAINPAGESLVWAMAKETGKYDLKLRYPAEDSRYEKEKIKALGLLNVDDK